MLVRELDVEARVPDAAVGFDARHVAVASDTWKQSCKSSELLRSEVHMEMIDRYTAGGDAATNECEDLAYYDGARILAAHEGSL